VVQKHGPQLPPAINNEDEDEDEDEDEGEHDTVDRDVYSDGFGDFRGYFDDGAYIAAPSADDSNGHDDGLNFDEQDADSADAEQARIQHVREAYYRSMISRFQFLRRILHTTPPKEAVIALPPTHSFRVGRFGAQGATFNIWSERLRATDPRPAQVASMSKDAVLRVLRILLGGQFLRRGQEISERTTRWLWALLARLPERGALDHVDIGCIRELGRRAVLLATTMSDMAELRYEIDRHGGDLGVHDSVDGPSDDEDDGEMDERLAEVEVDGVDESGSNESGTGDLSSQAEAGDAKQNGHAATQPSVYKDRERDVESQSDGSMDLSDGEIDEAEELVAEKATDNKDGTQNGEACDSSTNVDDDVLADIAEAKTRLLQRLKQDCSPDSDAAADEADTPPAEYSQSPADTNLHATINMTLTIVGELYGQRDLLEFRHPFPQA
jgi:hypothetical protein